MEKKKKKLIIKKLISGTFVRSFVRFKLISASTKKFRIPSKLFFRPLPNFDSFDSIKKIENKKMK